MHTETQLFDCPDISLVLGSNQLLLLIAFPRPYSLAIFSWIANLVSCSPLDGGCYSALDTSAFLETAGFGKDWGTAFNLQGCKQQHSEQGSSHSTAEAPSAQTGVAPQSGQGTRVTPGLLPIPSDSHPGSFTDRAAGGISPSGVYRSVLC